ncbi:MAG: flavodoxin domain-containing protein [Candidatus Bathyarchaeota archaeon]|jgi:flavorubredoxin
MKIFVVYDSQTGNTEKMAKATAKGAGSVKGAKVEIKKVGEPFPLSKMTEADGVLIGSPCIYADVTPALRRLLVNLKGYINVTRQKVKKAGIFGSYGWDGAWVMEDKLRSDMESLGFNVWDKPCVEVGISIQHHPDDHLLRCEDWGKEFAEALK